VVRSSSSQFLVDLPSRETAPNRSTSVLSQTQHLRRYTGTTNPHFLPRQRRRPSVRRSSWPMSSHGVHHRHRPNRRRDRRHRRHQQRWNLRGSDPRAVPTCTPSCWWIC